MVQKVIHRRLACTSLLIMVAAVMACGGGGGSTSQPSDTPGDSDKVVLTATAVSADSISLSWTNLADNYSWTPEEVFSYIYRGGVKIATIYGFSYADTGLQPDTTYCYDVTVGAVYCFLWSCYSTPWLSNTACATTLYGLRVQSTSPPAGATSVPVNSTISATFNGQIDPLSVTSSSFIVSGPSGTITGSLAVSGSTVTFTPSSYLLYNTSYTATITTAVKDLDGYSLTSDCTWTFTAGFTLDRPLVGVWGSSENDVFVVGQYGPILHYNGKAWIDMAGTTTSLIGVWGSSGSEVFAVGINGTILHYNGSSWTVMPSGTTNYLRGVWGSSGIDVFAVGDGSTIRHYDGSSWTIMTLSKYYNFLNGVWGSSGNDVFVVGEFSIAYGYTGVILHYNGSAWAAMP